MISLNERIIMANELADEFITEVKKRKRYFPHLKIANSSGGYTKTIFLYGDDMDCFLKKPMDIVVNTFLDQLEHDIGTIFTEIDENEKIHISNNRVVLYRFNNGIPFTIDISLSNKPPSEIRYFAQYKLLQ